MIEIGRTYNTTAGDTITVDGNVAGVWTATYQGDLVHITGKGRIVGKHASLLFNDNPDGVNRKRFTITGTDSK